MTKFNNFKFYNIDISNKNSLETIFKKHRPQKVVNLAAQAGVRYSLSNPRTYIRSNIVGFINILEFCRHYSVEGLIYASSSSVYGSNKKIPFSVNDNTDSPISIYAASKKSNELMAYSYSHLFNLHTTGLRFFTVYGPWGRPDMAIYIFTERILKNQKIKVFNYGDMQRDFTYIDDITNGIFDSIKKNYKCEVFNLGNNKPTSLLDLIRVIEKGLNKTAKIEYEKIQPGDVKRTYSDIDYTKEKLSFEPSISINEGILKFISWYKKINIT